MSLADTLRSGHNSNMLAIAAQVAPMFSNVKAVGAISKAAALLHAVDTTLRAASGGEHSIFTAAAKTVENASPRFENIVKTTMGAAHSEGQESVIDKAKGLVAKMAGHLTGKGETTGEVAAQSTGAAAADAAKVTGRA